MKKCNICHHETKLKFSIKDKDIDRDYFECSNCYFLSQQSKLDSNKQSYIDDVDWERDDPAFKERAIIIAEKAAVAAEEEPE